MISGVSWETNDDSGTTHDELHGGAGHEPGQQAHTHTHPVPYARRKLTEITLSSKEVVHWKCEEGKLLVWQARLESVVAFPRGTFCHPHNTMCQRHLPPKKLSVGGWVGGGGAYGFAFPRQDTFFLLVLHFLLFSLTKFIWKVVSIIPACFYQFKYPRCRNKCYILS